MTTRMLENLYAELRRCRVRCDRKPYVEHKAEGDHDCKKAKCKPHKCSRLLASAVRQVHSIISGILGAADRWDWIPGNPAKAAKRRSRSSRNLSRLRPLMPHVSRKRRPRWMTTGERWSGCRCVTSARTG
jgi:hypothetical protein